MIGVPFRITENPTMLDRHEDWSRVRSPSRALRRMRYGHRQNITVTYSPSKQVLQFGDMFVMHPVTARAFRAELSKKAA